ncbi:hypothetical protein D3C86_1228260 [compost metagenome]
MYFEFLPINLRPDAELEAYYGTRQKRILELLSWGVINDAQACYELGLRPQGLQSMLAGTQFYTKSKASDATETDRSTSAGAALSPDTPAQTGGDDQ